MRVGYGRVSGTDQHIDAQLERLSDCEKVFYDKLSGSKTNRPELAAALEFVRTGDTLVCTRLDRLARSVGHLCSIAETLSRKGVALQVLDQAIDTSTPTGKLLFHMLAAIAEFELSIRKEQQRAGIAYAKAAGKPTGRRVLITGEELQRARQMRQAGMAIRTIAGTLRRKRSTVDRALRRLEEQELSTVSGQ